MAIFARLSDISVGKPEVLINSGEKIYGVITSYPEAVLGNNHVQIPEASAT